MNNQLLLWATFFIPWLTLFFMKREDIKRFMPVGLLAALASVSIHEAGAGMNWWVIKETAFPLYFLPYLIGLHPVFTMWIFKFTYKKIWLYLLVEIVANLGFVYLFIGWLITSRNIAFVNYKLLLFGIVMALGVLLYGYQMWQEGIFKHPYRERKEN